MQLARATSRAGTLQAAWALNRLVLANNLSFDVRVQPINVVQSYADTLTKREQYVIFDGKPHRLRLCMNGMADAGREYNLAVTQVIVEGGYVQSQYDQCLFIKKISEGRFIYILMFVDDFKAIANKAEDITDFVRCIEKKYTVTRTTTGIYLGITQERLEDGMVAYYEEVVPIIYC